MKLCFYQRISLIVVSIFMLILLLFFFGSRYLQKYTRFEAEQMLHQNLAVHLVADNPLLNEGVYDYAALENLFHTLMLLGPRFEFYYLDSHGTVLTHSAKKSETIRDTIDIGPIKAFIENSAPYPIFADDPKDPQRKKIFTAASVHNGNALQGYLYVIIGGSAYDSILSELQDNQILREFFMFVVSGLAALLAIMLTLFKLITAPLRQLSADMTAFKEAAYQLDNARLSNQKWCPDSRSEIDKLGCSFNDLFTHVNMQFQALAKINDHRKEMLADLSHDLRTPLASMHGYIETLYLQGDTLTQEDRQRFISICMRNMNNLKMLIDQIFELAYLEGGQVRVDSEVCAVGEFIHDIASKFSLEAKARSVRLNHSPPKFEGFIFTDLGKLERILSNLIDNALRHTPEGGEVTLLLEPHQHKLTISVIDTGIGIEPEELDAIFTPRYQASNTKRQPGKNVGLGLAISQKLVCLLNSNLIVTSKPQRGTKFSFDVPLANHSTLSSI